MEASPKTKKHMNPYKKDKIQSLMFIMPWIIGFLVFTLIPMLFSAVLSLCEWSVITGLEGIKFVGFQNYVDIFTIDTSFLQSLKVTFTYSIVFLPLSQALAILIAVLLNQKVKGIKIFRTLYFMPSIIPTVAVSLMWVWIFNPEFGVINRLLAVFGIKGPDWLQDPNTALMSLVLMGLWGVGSTMIIYLSSLQGVDTSLYESADIDGANSVTKFFRITLPMISPTIFFNVVMGMIGSFQYFAQANIMTQGGPLKSTLFYNLYLYNVAFKEYKMGYGSALAWIMFFIIMLFTAIIFKSSSMWVYYETDGKKAKKSKKLR